MSNEPKWRSEKKYATRAEWFATLDEERKEQVRARNRKNVAAWRARQKLKAK